MRFLYFSAAVASVLAAPLEDRQLSPSVTISAGTIRGSRGLTGVESFNGIPFAKPPVGPLRLKPPQPYTGSFPGGTFDATGSARSCPNGIGSTGGPSIPANATSLIGPIVLPSTGSEEDCLSITVQRPAGTDANSKLPVIFWIYGGGFSAGSSSMYDGTPIINHGTIGPAKGHPFVYVAVNYRLGAFGFMAGKELQRDGSTNLGLRDQRLGLQWTADNIAAFGGDPSKVTIWGESAGAISVFNQLIINNGDHTYKGQPLFRAAMMNSGSAIPAEPVDTGKAQDVYNAVVAAAGCSGSSNTLACLRQVPYQTLQSAGNSLPGIFSYRALDLAFLPRPDPSDNFFPRSPDSIIAGTSYAKVPIIIGDQEDEGTLFSQTQSNVTTTELLVKYLQSYFPVSGRDLMPALVATYPDTALAGSPFRTGELNNIRPQYKRLAAILGDITFTLTRRAYLLSVADQVPAWSFLDTHLYGTPLLGTFHGSDFAAYFFGLGPPNTINTFRTAVISFAYYMDPNRITNLNWPQYKTDNTTGRQILQIGALTNTIIKDDFRDVSSEFLRKTTGKIRI